MRAWRIALFAAASAMLYAGALIAQPSGQGGQGPGGQGPGGRPPGGHHDANGPQGEHHMVHPLMKALDLNGDGELSADEIAKASESLKKLADANGWITREKLMPPPPPGAGDANSHQGPGGTGPHSGPAGDAHRPPGGGGHGQGGPGQGGPGQGGPGQGGPGQTGQGQGGPAGQGGPGGHGDQSGQRPPHPVHPLMMVLDTDHDGQLSPQEIADAPKNLLKLDKNGDGKISRDELRPPLPPGARASLTAAMARDPAAQAVPPAAVQAAPVALGPAE